MQVLLPGTAFQITFVASPHLQPSEDIWKRFYSLKFVILHVPRTSNIVMSAGHLCKWTQNRRRWWWWWSQVSQAYVDWSSRRGSEPCSHSGGCQLWWHCAVLCFSASVPAQPACQAVIWVWCCRLATVSNIITQYMRWICCCADNCCVCYWEWHWCVLSHWCACCSNLSTELSTEISGTTSSSLHEWSLQTCLTTMKMEHVCVRVIVTVVTYLWLWFLARDICCEKMSVCHTAVFCRNSWTYRKTLFTVR